MRKLALVALTVCVAGALFVGCKKNAEAAAKTDPENKTPMSTYDQMQGKSGQGSSHTGGAGGTNAVTPGSK